MVSIHVCLGHMHVMSKVFGWPIVLLQFSIIWIHIAMLLSFVCVALQELWNTQNYGSLGHESIRPRDENED